VGVGLTVVLAFLSQEKEPPTAGTAAFFVFASALSTLAAATLYSRIGRADPRHARSAVRRLVTTGTELAIVVEELEAARVANNIQALRAAVLASTGRLHASQLNLLDAIRDWEEFHREALRGLVPEEEEE